MSTNDPRTGRLTDTGKLVDAFGREIPAMSDEDRSIRMPDSQFLDGRVSIPYECPGCVERAARIADQDAEIARLRHDIDAMENDASVIPEDLSVTEYVTAIHNELTRLRAVVEKAKAIIRWYEDDHERDQCDDTDVPDDLLQLERELETAEAARKEQP